MSEKKTYAMLRSKETIRKDVSEALLTIGNHP